MNARERLVNYLDGHAVDRIPRIESKFAPETIELWRSELGDSTPEAHFKLDLHESVPVQMRKFDPPDDPAAIWNRPYHWYDAQDPRRLPEDWETWSEAASNRTHLISFEPWHEGMFQVLGIRNAASFVPVLQFLIDRPRDAEHVIETYTTYLEAMIDKICARVAPDYAVFYEPIASNDCLVISPVMARRLLEAPYRRICERLQHHGIRHRFIWSSGRILDLIPLWLDVGMNGLCVDQACAAGVDYVQVREEFGPQLALLGGIDNAALQSGEEAIHRELESKLPPLLESGRYLPGVDDTVRATIPYEHYVSYRRQLHRISEEA